MIIERNLNNASLVQPESQDGQVIRLTTAIDHYSLTDPLGTYEGYAFPTIDVRSYPPNTVVTFEADVFTADMHYDVAANDFLYNATDVNSQGFPAKNTTLKDPSSGISFTYAGVHKAANESGCPYIKTTFPRYDNPEQFTVNLNGDYVTQQTLSNRISTSTVAKRIEKTSYQCKQGGPTDSVALIVHDLPSPLKAMFLLRFTTLRCQPRYSVRRLPISLRDNRLTNNVIDLLETPLEHIPSSLLPNISVMDIYKLADPKGQLPQSVDLLNGTFTADFMPLIVWRSSKIVLALFTVALIVTLEVLNHYSISKHGILTIPDGQYVSYSWVYILTLTMVLVNVLYGMLDSAAVLFEPYNVLRRGYPLTAKTMLEDLASIIAGSMLSIAVSGLYTAKSVSFDKTVSLLMQTYPQKHLSYDVYGQVESTNLPAILIQDKMSYPKWTYEGFSLSRVSPVKNDTTVLSGNSGFDIEGPEKSAESYFNSNTYYTRVTPKNPPEGCELAINITVYINLSLNQNSPWYIGDYSDVYDHEGSSCPSWLMWTGLLSDDARAESFSIAHCTPYLEELEVDVTFADSNFTIDTAYPPKAVLGTNKVVSRNIIIAPANFDRLFNSGLP
ncbi:hypothetical protein N7499_007674 [Penicillium canescens]|nr:hypothetical protein N7499_007674 [Penicillium canescens]KAJ6158006.1 hypothetical protein N7485_010832 [Penicillium canescens]